MISNKILLAKGTMDPFRQPSKFSSIAKNKDQIDLEYFLRRIDQGCHINPEKEAVIFKEKKLPIANLRDRAYILAHALKSIGIKKRYRVEV